MKIRNPRLIRTAGWLGTQAAFGLVRSLQFEYAFGGRVPRDMPPGDPARHIYAIWHEYLLLPTIKFGDPSLAVLISKHADGQVLGSLIDAMGMGQVLGSTNRGGVEAVRKLIHDPEARRHLAVTPDGPRGPRRVVQPGIVYVASRTGMTIVPLGVGFDNPRRAGSWDKFAVPRFRSRARVVNGEPISVPAGLKTADLEEYRRIVQARLDEATAAAEAWAATGVPALPQDVTRLRRAA